MSDASLKSDRARHTMVAAGVLASGVAAELVRPLRELREGLAELVERLDHFANHAKGPHPYPYDDTKLLREELAGAYLSCRKVTRLADDLHSAVDHRAIAAEASDVNRLVEAAMNLARHRISASTEVFVDRTTAGILDPDSGHRSDRQLGAAHRSPTARGLAPPVRFSRDVGDRLQTETVSVARCLIEE